MVIFWRFMCWIDSAILHPFSDWMDYTHDWHFADEALCNFCQWSHAGLCKHLYPEDF